MRLVPTNESKEIINKYENIWNKIRESIRLVTKNSVDYDGKYLKIKFDSDNKLSLDKAIEISFMTIIVRAISHENNIHKFSSMNVCVKYKNEE